MAVIGVALVLVLRSWSMAAQDYVHAQAVLRCARDVYAVRRLDIDVPAIGTSTFPHTKPGPADVTDDLAAGDLMFYMKAWAKPAPFLGWLNATMAHARTLSPHRPAPGTTGLHPDTLDGCVHFSGSPNDVTACTHMYTPTKRTAWFDLLHGHRPYY